VEIPFGLGSNYFLIEELKNALAVRLIFATPATGFADSLREDGAPEYAFQAEDSGCAGSTQSDAGMA
jgi:hypothetical protein